MSALYQIWFNRLFKASLSSAFPEYEKKRIYKACTLESLSLSQQSLTEASVETYVLFGNLKATFLCTDTLKFVCCFLLCFLSGLRMVYYAGTLQYGRISEIYWSAPESIIY